MPLDLSKTRTATKPIPTEDPDVFVKVPPKAELERVVKEGDEINAEHEKMDAERDAIEAEREAIEKKNPHDRAMREKALAKREKALAERNAAWEKRAFDQACYIFAHQLCDEDGNPPLQQTPDEIEALGGQALTNYRWLVEDTLATLGKGGRPRGFRK